MAQTQRTARSWLFVLGLLWLAFFGAVLIVMITQGPGAFVAAEEAEDDEIVAVVDTDGWFTEEQASRGAEDYAQHCAQCHGDQLGGGVGPALAGSSFWDRWENDTVHTFYEVTRQTMPQGAPGSLADETYADITAFVLQVNGFPAGNVELPPDEAPLQELPIDRGLTEDVGDDADEPAVGEAVVAEEPEADPDTPGEPGVDAEARAEERSEEPAEPAEPEESAPENDVSDEPEETEAETDEAEEPDERDVDPDEPEDREESEADPDERTVDVDEDGYFTEMQVQAGEDAFAQHCASCHGADLQGEPPLRGGGFPERYTTVWELYQYTRQTMPQDAPGSLDERTYVDTIAYVLHENGYPIGERRLEPVRVRMEAMELDPELADDPADAPTDEPSNDETEEPDGESANDENANDEADANDETDTAVDGWFTDEQAERGADAYQQSCAECHGDDLQGNPPLQGEGFHDSFDTVWDLFDYTRLNMPQDDPGSLDDDTYADIIAFVLRENDFPAGDEELEGDDQDAMQEMPFDPDELSGEGANGQEEAGADAAEEPDAEEAAGEPEGPEPGRAWLEIDSQPANVTINLLGPDGFARRAIGAQTLRDLRPGIYLVAASRGHESHMVTVILESGETARVSLVLNELSRSRDVPAEPAVPTQEVPAIPMVPEEGRLIGDTRAAPAMAPAPDEPDEPDEPTDEPTNDEADEPNDDTANDEADTNDETDTAVDGWFTDEQAERGADAYQQSCAECHGDDLQGNPPLQGEGFHDSFDTVWQLFDYTRLNMPQLDPGSLGDDTYADIIAFVLRENDFPAGDEELESDEDALQDMPFDPDAANGGEEANGQETNDEEATGENANDEGANGERAEEPTAEASDTRETDAEGADAGRAGPTAITERRDAGPGTDPEGQQLQAERGGHAYALHCSRCHGVNLEGDVAPALGGEVFLERWGGHPVDWLYFQARAAMPPHGPAFLGEQTYVDIIVFALTEAGVLEGFEEFRTHDEEFRTLIIRPRGEVEEFDALEQQVERLREQLHAPHEDPEVPVADPIVPTEWPDDAGTSPIGPPGRIDAAVPLESGAAPAPDDADDTEDDSDDDGAHHMLGTEAVGA